MQMHCSVPPFTKPEAAYDSARLYRETSEIAAAQDAKLDGRPRDDLQSIMADLHADLKRAYENAKCRIDAVQRRACVRELTREAQARGEYDPPFEGDPADCALPPSLARAVKLAGIGDVERIKRPVMAAEADRIADAAPLGVENAYAMGWRRSALWASRADLIADIDSPAFYADRAKDLYGASPDDRL